MRGVIFFFDRSADLYIARMLHAWDRENSITHQDDDQRFSQDDPDTKIISLVASDSPKPTFITADEANRKRPDERRALARSGMNAVFLKSAYHDLDFHVRSWQFLRLWPQLVRDVSRARVPTAFEIAGSMRKLDRICATSELDRRPVKRAKR